MIPPRAPAARALRRGGVGAALAATVACAPSAPPAPPPLDSARFGAVSGGPSGRAILDRDRPKPESVVLAVEPAAAGDRVSAMLELPATACALVIARGSPSIEDIDLFAYGEDGAVLGVDEAPDSTPALLVCPPHPGRLFLVARVASGHGVVALGAERVAPAEAARAAERIGASGVARTERREPSAFGDLDATVAGRRASVPGKWQEQRRVALPVDSRTPAVVTAAIEAGACLDVLAVPGDGIAQLEVSVLDEEGAILARGSSVDETRTAVLCSPEPATVTIEVRPHAGRGLAAVVLSATTGGGQAEVVTPERVDLGPIGELEAEVAALARRVGAGAGPARRLHAGRASVGVRESQDLALPAGCSRLDVVGGRPLRGLRSWLYDPKGQLVARGRGLGHATLFACGAGSTARLDVEATTTSGAFVVELRPLATGRPELGQHPLAAGRLLARLNDREVDPAAEGLEVRALSLGAGALHGVDLTLPPGRCLDAWLALGPGASGVELRVVTRPARAEVARGAGADTAWATTCAPESGPLDLTLEATVAAGSAASLVAWRAAGARP